MTVHVVPPRRSLLAPLALLTCLGILTLGGCGDRLPTALGPDGLAFTQVATNPVVNSLADPGDGTCDATECTLREALAFASVGATITFSVTGTITLAGSELDVMKDVTISGPGATSLTIDADNLTRVFWVDAGGSNVTISGLTITRGYTRSGGAGILNWGNLTVKECAITGNNAYYAAGGGIRSMAGTLLVVSTTISGNAGQILSGGVSSETSASTTFVNSTISGNLAPDGLPGAGVFSGSGITRISHSTITGHSSGVMAYTGSTVEVKGSIIWGNHVDVQDYTDEQYTSLGHNLIGTAGSNIDLAAVFSATGDQTGVSDALLETLQLNSPGTTATHELLAGSPALDAGTCTDHTGATMATDQRGVIRPQGSGCDIGAYEKATFATVATEVNTLGDHDDGSCDASDCTLREAIASAGSGTIITFASGLTGTIRLGSPLVIIRPVAINGPGASALAVGGTFYRVFDIQPIGVGQVEIRGLTIRDGQSEANGAGIIIRSASVLLEGVAVHNNRFSTGGLEFGAGICIDGTSTVTIRNSSITNNQSPKDGGGISVSAGSTLAVENSTIAGNSASRYGAGLYSAGTVTLTNTTIHGNSASVGGGVFIYDGSFDLSFSTIASNSATWHGGGMYRLSGSGTLRGTILGGGNTADENPDLAGKSGGVAASYSLIQSAADATLFGISDGVGGNIVGSAPDLDVSLADNGGPTRTRALLTGSPAIDHIPAGAIGCGSTMTTDQRGVSRPQGSACDIGAYELQTTVGPVTPTFTFDLSGLSEKMYGDPDFGVEGHVTTNSTGEVTFALGSGSVGCSVASAGLVTITGAATGSSYCIIEATLAPDATFTGAGPESELFNIARAATTVAIANLPASPVVGGSFTPTYTTSSDGATSVASNTPAVCTVSGGAVSFIAAGDCILVASVAEGTNWLPATGDPQSVTVQALSTFASACTYTVNRKTERRQVTVTWEKAEPGVTLIRVSNGKDADRQLAPTASGSWTTGLRDGIPTYGLWGGSRRRDNSTVLVPGGTACTRID